jgi:hypothetical protein
MTMARKQSKRAVSPEQRLAAWIHGATPERWTCREVQEAGWEAGQVGHITIGDANYERFEVDESGSYVVICWTDEGGIEDVLCKEEL